MNYVKFKHDVKALSPVIATIILIAVTVAIAIAVAVWMGALTLTYTKTEELRVIVYGIDVDNKYIYVRVLNTGSATTSIVIIEVNDVVYGDDAGEVLFNYDSEPSDWGSATDFTTVSGINLSAGKTVYIRITMNSITPNTIYRVSVTTSNNNVYWGEARAPTG